MTPKRIMLIAGEASGDVLGAELVRELRAAFQRLPTYTSNVQPLYADLAPRFFGAGGPHMAEAGVELAFDMTKESLIGLPGPRDCLKFLRRLDQLLAMAIEREPHAIVCIDFPLFNALFAASVKKRVRARWGPFNNWNPRIVKYISPQVWASREGRVHKIARDFDLLLSIFPFEKDWYAARVPNFHVEFVGHPILDRHGNGKPKFLDADFARADSNAASKPQIVLLPGSRNGELKRHLPVMLKVFEILRSSFPDSRARMVLPTEALAERARTYGFPASVEIQCGGLAEALSNATIAISKTGTITMECAYFGVPTVTFYRPSLITYEVGKYIVKVKWASMPNLLANEAVFTEFIHHDATPENIAGAALELLRDNGRREKVRSKLAEVIASLGKPGASRRATEAIIKIIS